MPYLNQKLIVTLVFLSLACTLQCKRTNGDKFLRSTDLPYSRGPGPIFAFGQGIQPKNLFVARSLGEWIETDFHTYFILHNHYYYGITDKITIAVKQPIILKYNNNGVNGRGLGNLILENENVIFQVIESDFRFRVTFLERLIFPTATSKVPTFLSLHSTNFFLGMTQSNTTGGVYQYMELGIFLPTTKHHFNFGTNFFYNFGIGYALINTPEFYFSVDYEVSGEYQKSQKNNGISDFTTGGNRIYFGPAFRVVKRRIIIQGGIQYPYVKTLRAKERSPENYRAALSFAALF